MPAPVSFAPYEGAFQQQASYEAAHYAPPPRRTEPPAAAAPRRRPQQPRPSDVDDNPSGFSPETWGPSMWFMVHLIAATYPVNPTPQDKANAASFFQSLQHVLPCGGCRRGYEIILGTEPTRLTPQVFASRASLFKWTVDVHNRVNEKLGKPVDSNWKAWYKQYDALRSG